MFSGATLGSLLLIIRVFSLDVFMHAMFTGSQEAIIPGA